MTIVWIWFVLFMEGRIVLLPPLVNFSLEIDLEHWIYFEKNADIFFLCPRGKKWVVNHFSKLNSFRDMNFQKWSITDESWRLSVSYTFMNDSSVIDHFWKFISRKLLSFEKWFTIHFLPHGHRKNMSAFLFPFSTLLVNNFHAKP